jgi:glutamate synthase domain-containing protein 2
MSYGALSANAISALNLGAKQGGFYHNTGEGGISKVGVSIIFFFLLLVFLSL